MNYSTDVKFSNNLVKKGKTTITYTGSLFRTGSQAITLVYGFGDNWENTTEKEMTKNENSFSVEIELLDFDKINFCFRNSDNIWDNNNYLNYIAPISEPENEYNFIINENLMDEMLDNLLETDLSKCEASDVQVENIATQENQTEEANIALVENSIVSEETFAIDIPEESPADIQEFIGESTEETDLTNDLEAEFSSISDDAQEDKKENIINFDMDSIVDEILSPIAEAKEDVQYSKVTLDLEEDLDLENSTVEAFSNEENNNDEVQNIEGTENEEASEASLLEDLTSDDTTFVGVEESKALLVSPRSLSKFYILKKKIKLAVYKFFTAIPKIIESNFNEEKNQ